MRATIVLIVAVLLAAHALAMHNDGKGTRSLGGATVPRTDTILTLQAEDFPEKPVGAREGDAWNLTGYGTISTAIDVPSTGVVWFDIRARGWHPEGMRNPHMHILIDGEQRAEWDVRGDWLTYPQSVPLLAGRHTVSVDNFNNYRADVADRTLVVDWLGMTAPTLEGSPRVPAGGYVVVDAADIHNSVTGQLERSELARNNTQWLQWGVGCFAESVVLDGTGAHDLTARLRGNVHEGVGTRVQVRVDGSEIEEYLVGEEWEEKTTRFEAPSGAHVVEVCYDNDEPGKKRNLWLDEISIASLTPGGAPPGVVAPWPAAHAALDNHRHVPSAIARASIASAREVWTYAATGPVTGTPAYADGVVYFGDHKGMLHAVDAAGGGRRWAVDLGAGVDSSVALDDRSVYVGDMDGWISARSRADGALLWRVRADEVEGTHLYGSPVLHAGVVYTGVASEQTLIEYEGPQTFRGSVAAFRAEDGTLLWKTHTQSADGKGVSVWSTPAIDPELGLLFVGTGNSYGEPVGEYTDSILALRLADGAIVWSYQATKGDAFNARGAPGPDRDFGASPLLVEAAGRKLVVEGDKGGIMYALDRASGELVWKAQADFRVQGVAPSQVEGFLGTPSYHDGTIYAPTTARSMVHAIDAASGTIKWARELNPLPLKYGDRMFAPSTAAEDVVLQGNAFGRVYALDMRTGEIVANLSAGGGVQAGIALAGDRFFVPHVGEHLWSARGGVTAFVVDARTVPTTPTTPATPTAVTTPSQSTEGPGAIEGGVQGGIERGVPGAWGVLALLTLGVAAALRRPRAR